MKGISKQTAKWAILIIGLPILINFILGIYTPYDLYVVGEAENWLGFYGSYIGAIIASGVAYVILWHTIEDNKKSAIRELKKEELYDQRKMMSEQMTNPDYIVPSIR